MKEERRQTRGFQRKKLDEMKKTKKRKMDQRKMRERIRESLRGARQEKINRGRRVITKGVDILLSLV